MVDMLFHFQIQNGLLLNGKQFGIYNCFILFSSADEEMVEANQTNSTFDQFETFNSLPILSPQTPGRPKLYY